MRRASMSLCVLALLLPGAARAQLNGPVAPAGAPVVAGPLADGTALVAFDRGNELCVALAGHRSSCGPPPTEGQPRLEFGERVFGAVSADAATVEVLAAGGSQTVPAGAGAYQGRFAGRAHFFLSPAKIRFPPYRVRVLDAQGRVVFATDIAPAPAVAPAVPVAAGRVNGTPWRAVAVQRTALAATPLDRGRTELITCLRLESGSERGPGDDGCSEQGHDPGGVSFSAAPHCALGARAVAGIAGPEVERLDAVLGDGTRRRVGLHALPVSFGDARRAFVLAVGPGVAVRRLTVRTHVRARVAALRLGPVEAECQRGANFGVAYGLFGFTASPATSSGPLLARDDGDDLCVGLGTIVATDCRLPPTEPARSRIEVRHAGHRTFVLAVVPPQVASLRLRLDRGAPVTVPSADLPGYTGRYAGLVKAATVAVAGTRRVFATELLAADGHVLLSLPGPDPRPLDRSPRVVARLPGGVALSATADCIQIGTGTPTRDRADCVLTPTPALVTVPCAARQTVVVARTRRGLTVTTDGGTVRGRRSGAYVVAVVPARSAVRAIRLAGARSVPLPLPPASRQCGYITPLPAVIDGWEAGGGRSTAAGHASMMSDDL